MFKGWDRSVFLSGVTTTVSNNVFFLPMNIHTYVSICKAYFLCVGLLSERAVQTTTASRKR